MRMKGVPFLVGLLGVVLSVGGVFAAWVFSDNVFSQRNGEVPLSASPSNRWEFENTLVTFNAGEHNGFKGIFSDGTTTKFMENHISECISYENYITAIDENPQVYRADGSVNNDYIFAYWTYNEDGVEKVFNFDVTIDVGLVLTAKYESVSNPSLWKFVYDENGAVQKTERVATFFINDAASEGTIEYMATNVVVEDKIENRDYHYLIQYKKDYLCMSSNKDYVSKGFYTVYFTEEAKTNINEWVTFGGNAYFQRQYHFTLMGNPNNGWNISTESQFFGYVSQVASGNNTIKTYRLNKVVFRDDVLSSDGTVNFDFKPYEPYFDIWGHIKVNDYTSHPHMDPGSDTESNKYVRKHQDTSNDNLTLVFGVTQRVFTIEIDVTFGQPGNNYILDGVQNSYVPGEYPYYIVVRMKPYVSTVYFYNDDKTTIYAQEEIDYGQKVSSSIYENFPAASKEVVAPNVLVGKYWADIDTGEIVDFATLDITRDQYVYPIYQERVWTATVHYMTTWTGSGWSEKTSITENLYDGEKINVNMLGNLATPKTGYSLKGWQYSTSSSGITSTTYESAANIVDNHDFTGDVYIYPIFMANLVYKQSSSFYPVTSGNEYTISSTSIDVGRNHVLGTTLYTNDGSKLLTTSSGIYKLTYSSSWTITRKIGFQNQDTSSWGQAGARYAAYVFNDSSNKWFSFGKGTNTTFWIYIDYSYTTIIFCRMDPNNSTNGWSNQTSAFWNQSADIPLKEGYSSSAPCYYKSNNWWNDWTGSWGNGN